MAWNDVASNQMVSFTDAQGGGFTLNAGQSAITSNQCITKSEALTIYDLSSSAMQSFANNQLVPKINYVSNVPIIIQCGVWDSAIYPAGTPDTFENYIQGYIDFSGTLLPGESIDDIATSVSLESYTTIIDSGGFISSGQTFTGPFGSELEFSGSGIGTFSTIVVSQNTNSNPVYSLRFVGTLVTDQRTIPIDITSIYDTYTPGLTPTSSKNNCIVYTSFEHYGIVNNYPGWGDYVSDTLYLHYHSGAGIDPAIGDFIYTDTNGTIFNGGNSWWMFSIWFNAWTRYQISTTGEVLGYEEESTP
jgi:hypothetical protein